MVNWAGVGYLVGLEDYSKKIKEIQEELQKREKEEALAFKLANKNAIELELMKNIE
jgi:hypothetical protein